MEYLTLISIILLVIVAVGFYIFYCRLNENKYVVEELRKTVKHLGDKEPLGYEKPINQDKDPRNTSNPAAYNNQEMMGTNAANTKNNFAPQSNQNKSTATLNKNQEHTVVLREEGGNNHGSIVNEQKIPVNICAASEPSEESHNCTNYAPIPDEVDNVQLTNMDNMSEFPADLLTPSPF